MSEERRSYYVDGEYNDIVYEIKNELRSIYASDDPSTDESVLSVNAQIITDVLVLLNSDMQDTKEYQWGVFSPHKRYYIKVDASLVLALASFLHKVIDLFQNGDAPDPSIMDQIGDGIGVFCGFDTLKKKLSTKIKEEEFCVLLCAHQKKTGEYISIHQVHKSLCSSICPYSKLFQAAYGHPCMCLSPNGKCSKTLEEVKGNLDNLNPKFDVLKFKDDLYQIT